MDNDTGSSAQSTTVSYVTPLLISLIGIASSSLAIILYHLILIKFCLRPDRQQSQESNTHDTRQDELGRSQWDVGLDEDILDSIPIFSYSIQKAKLLRVDQNECIICLGELEHGDKVRLLPTCTHAFHVSCIDKWFRQHSRCPLCRCSVVVPVLAPEQESDHGGPFHVVLNLPADNNELHVPQKHGSSGDSRACCSSSSGVGLLKHSASLKLPRDQETAQAQVACLKRSLSMDQCYYISRVTMQRDHEKACSSSKQELGLQNKTSEPVKSTRPFDRLSNMFARSFSQIHNNRSTVHSAILPI